MKTIEINSARIHNLKNINVSIPKDKLVVVTGVSGGWGLALKPRDMARFGYLYLNGGQWDGEQIIPQKWVEDSVSPHTPGYGYQWWLRDVNGVFAFSAVGQGGQHIFCIPQRDLVVVVASRLGSRWRDRWPLLEEFVIPAVVR